MSKQKQNVLPTISGYNPFRAPKPLPILIPSNFGPCRKTGFHVAVVKAIRSSVATRENILAKKRATPTPARHRETPLLLRNSEVTIVEVWGSTPHF